MPSWSAHAVARSPSSFYSASVEYEGLSGFEGEDASKPCATKDGADFPRFTPSSSSPIPLAPPPPRAEPLVAASSVLRLRRRRRLTGGW